ncbi:MAG: class I SAM-dependent methyltransferase [Acidimicrobiia bacterium]
MHSVAHQVVAIHELAQGLQSPHVLEVGPGPGIAVYALRQAGFQVTTLDINLRREPDILGSVTEIPAEDASFDIGSACQILEHLPFAELLPALRQLRRVCRAGCVISLPDSTRHVRLAAHFPKLGQRSFAWVPPRRPKEPPERLKKIGHHWEIGYRGSLLRDVTAQMSAAGWRVARTWRVPELPWHRFFTLQ